MVSKFERKIWFTTLGLAHLFTGYIMYKKSNYISDKDFIKKNLDLSKVKESESIMKFVFEKNKKIVFLIDIDEFSNIKKIIEDSRLLIEEVFPDKVVFEREFRQ